MSNEKEEFALDGSTVWFYRFFFGYILMLSLLPSIDVFESLAVGRIRFAMMSQDNTVWPMMDQSENLSATIIGMFAFYLAGMFMLKSKLYFSNGQLIQVRWRGTRAINLIETEKIVIYKSRDGKPFSVHIYCPGRKRTSLFGYQKMAQLVKEIENRASGAARVSEKESRCDPRKPMPFMIIIGLSYLFTSLLSTWM